MGIVSNTVHPNFTHIGRPERFATDSSVHEHLKATGRENFHANLKEIDGLLTRAKRKLNKAWPHRRPGSRGDENTKVGDDVADKEGSDG